MPLRAVLLGQVSPDLLAELESLAVSHSLTLVGPHADRASASAALAASAQEMVVLTPALADGTAWALVRALSPEQRPAALVVIGARDEEAVAAFEVQATDFVRWPSSPERLAEAVSRARQLALQTAVLRTADELHRLLAEVAAAGGADMTGLFQRSAVESTESAAEAGRKARGATGTLVPTAPWRGSSRLADGRLVRVREAGEEAVLDLAQEDGGRGDGEGRPLRVLVREGRRTRFVPLADIDWFEADGNYIKVHAAGGAHRTRGTISAIESALDPRQFVRIHRRIVVNMDRVREMTPLPGGDGLLLLSDGSTLRLSRTYRARVR